MHGTIGDSKSRVRPRVVIVGAGFGGLNAALALKRAPVDIVLIDRRNYHLFQPLLYQVASAALAPADIAQPIRSILRGQRNAFVTLANVERVALEERALYIPGGRIEYDYLILAPGSVDNYFGQDAWRQHAPGMKDVDDATRIRSRLLRSFETAEIEGDLRFMPAIYKREARPVRRSGLVYPIALNVRRC